MASKHQKQRHHHLLATSSPAMMPNVCGGGVSKSLTFHDFSSATSNCVVAASDYRSRSNNNNVFAALGENNNFCATEVERQQQADDEFGGLDDTLCEESENDDDEENADNKSGDYDNVVCGNNATQNGDTSASKMKRSPASDFLLVAPQPPPSSAIVVDEVEGGTAPSAISSLPEDAREQLYIAMWRGAESRRLKHLSASTDAAEAVPPPRSAVAAAALMSKSMVDETTTSAATNKRHASTKKRDRIGALRHSASTSTFAGWLQLLLAKRRNAQQQRCGGVAGSAQLSSSFSSSTIGVRNGTHPSAGIIKPFCDGGLKRQKPSELDFGMGAKNEGKAANGLISGGNRMPPKSQSFTVGPLSTLCNSMSLSVVHEGCVLGSDGESLDISPCTSDQTTDSSCSGVKNGPKGEYIPQVKLRHKAGVGSVDSRNKWSEEDIQKRLSLPAGIRLPQSVIEKLNRTPALENPLTRKSRRASLSEIGFGRLETYRKLEDVGDGTYSTVFHGKSLLTGESVALKEIRLEHEEGAPCTAIREVSLLRNLQHANVVTLHDVIYTNRILTLVFEYVEYDLNDYMKFLDGPICLNNVNLFLVQLLRGLAYCHHRRVLHRDLKPQNLLINERGELKLADFGLARAQSIPTKTYSNEVVTLWYRPPDVLLGSKDYTSHIDIWGVGCIYYEMLMSRPMFAGPSADEQLALIFKLLGTPNRIDHSELFKLPAMQQPLEPPTNGYSSTASSSLEFETVRRILGGERRRPQSLVNPPRMTAERVDLLTRMMSYEGRQRISAVEAMRHPVLARSFSPDAISSLKDKDSVLSLPGVVYIRETAATTDGFGISVPSCIHPPPGKKSGGVVNSRSHNGTFWSSLSAGAAVGGAGREFKASNKSAGGSRSGGGDIWRPV